jgi:hypothetical protein
MEGGDTPVNSIYKIGIGTTAIAMAVALVLGPVLADAATDTISQTNEDTGNNSHNRNRTRINRAVRHHYDNRAHVRNRIHIDANTGHNESEKNTNGEDVDSGNIDALITLTNDLNQNIPEYDGLPEPSDTEVTQENKNTGNNSHNSNRVSIRERLAKRHTNRAHAENHIDVDANTGHNESEKNTNGGKVDSGDINVDIGVLNTLN